MADFTQTGHRETPQDLAQGVRARVLEMLDGGEIGKARQYARAMTLEFMKVASEHPSRAMYKALVVIASTAAHAFQDRSWRDEHALYGNLYAAHFLAVAAHACDVLGDPQSNEFSEHAAEVVVGVHEDMQALDPHSRARVARFLEQATKGLVDVNDPGKPIVAPDMPHDLRTMRWRDENCAFVVPAANATEEGYAMTAPASVRRVASFRIADAIYEWAYGHRRRDIDGGKVDAEQAMLNAGDGAKAIIYFSFTAANGEQMAHVALIRNKDGVVEVIDAQPNKWMSMQEYFSKEEPFNIKLWTINDPKQPRLQPSPRRLAKEVIAKLKDPELSNVDARKLRRRLGRPPEAVRYVVEGEVERFLEDPKRADLIRGMAELAATVGDVEAYARRTGTTPSRSQTGLRVRHREVGPGDGDIFVTRDEVTDEPRLTFPIGDGYALLDPKTLQCVGRVEDRPRLVIEITPVGRAQSITR